jgi:predicted HTH domain antitoxin
LLYSIQIGALAVQCLKKLGSVEAVQALENIDRSTLVKELIEYGLRYRVVCLYEKGKLSAGRGAEILGISLREFLDLLEYESIMVNWDSESIKEYMKQKCGERQARHKEA